MEEKKDQLQQTVDELSERCATIKAQGELEALGYLCGGGIVSCMHENSHIFMSFINFFLPLELCVISLLLETVFHFLNAVV